MRLARLLLSSSAIGVVSAFAVAASIGAAAADDSRVAMVIGQSDYKKGPLANPVRDAEAIAEMFKRAGYRVFFYKNLGYDEFKKKLNEFEGDASDADIAVVYYAGHGIEVNGANYLIPTDATFINDRHPEDSAIPMDRAVDAMFETTKLKVVILDACRDNPFKKDRIATRSQEGPSSNASSKPAGVNPGLAYRNTPKTIVAYATAQGATADDTVGDGQHSPFTSAILHHLTVPGVDVRLAFGAVWEEVDKITEHKQQPAIYASLGNPISLVPAAPAQPDGKTEYEFAKQVGTIEAWEVFIAHYPTGSYSDLARKEIERLQTAQRAAEQAKRAEEARSENARKQAEAMKAAEQARLAEEARRAAEAAKAAEQTRRAEEARKAAEAAKAAEQARLAEEARKAAEAAKAAEQARRAEEARKAAEVAKLAEQARLAEEARKAAEAAKAAEQARLAEEARRAAEAAKAAEQARLAEEARKAAETAKAVEQTRRAEEARKAAEAAKAAEQARLKAAEEARAAAEQARRAEEARKAAEAAKAAEQARLKAAEESRAAAEQARRVEEARKAAEAAKAAEQDRLAEEARKAAETAKAAEQARHAEDARKAAEAAEQARLKAADEAKAAAERAKLAELAHAKATEQAKAADEAKALEQAKVDEQTRIRTSSRHPKEDDSASRRSQKKESHDAHELRVHATPVAQGSHGGVHMNGIGF